MFNIQEYIKNLIELLKEQLGERLLYVGLQGSYLRNEATENSDIDIVVIISELSISDLRIYKKIIKQLPNYEKSCGFICGKEEFLHWNPLEICQFENCTTDYYGKISDMLPKYTKEDIVNYIKLSLGNIHHELCHGYLHSNDTINREKLPNTYKYAFFVLQNIYFLKTGIFYQTKKDILPHLSAADRKIMELSISLTKTTDYNFETTFEQILTWCQNSLKDI